MQCSNEALKSVTPGKNSLNYSTLKAIKNASLTLMSFSVGCWGFDEKLTTHLCKQSYSNKLMVQGHKDSISLLNTIEWKRHTLRILTMSDLSFTVTLAGSITCMPTVCLKDCITPMPHWPHQKSDITLRECLWMAFWRSLTFSNWSFQILFLNPSSVQLALSQLRVPASILDINISLT